jgi:UPF0755 protein
MRMGEGVGGLRSPSESILSPPYPFTFSFLEAIITQRKNPYQERPRGVRTLIWIIRLGVLFVALTGCLTAAFVLYTQWRNSGQGNQVVIEGGDPSLSSIEQLYLQTYLVSRVEQLQQPAGTGAVPVPFVVAPGETADTIAANLVTAGLLKDSELFLNYLQYYGLDSELEAGDFVLDPQQTIPELAVTLTQAIAQEIELRFLEGWRMEEMADYLATIQPAQIDAAVFHNIAQRQTAFDFSPYAFLASLPADTSLEGYLFPDTYRVPLDADTAYLIDLMLRNFGQRVTPAMQQAYSARGLSLHEAVTLAAIIEREAVVTEERPVIASVFYNRLAQDMKLQADPTVQYLLGYQPEADSWWKSPLFAADLELDSPYNTYVVTGLPPGPIANPGLSSLVAVAFPAETEFIFFVADCTAAVSGSHAFSVTYEEHLANVSQCQ